MEVALPNPKRERWQPLRSGLINLFKYDNETFHFNNGRLLLRGNNGAGKSRVLALQLPFLLDGEIIASRVEPDGDPAKRMEWHLLMNNRFAHRIGYTWIEFGRICPDGHAEYCTLGCGMEMSKGGKFQRWLFVTPLRVGDSIKLVREGGYPLTRDGLETSLTSGAIYPTVRDYRKAVDDHLFHLKEERYDALVNLLIQLRKPQLSRDLDEKVLSKALSDSLPPLDPATLNDCSEAFRELEDDKVELQNYERSSAALQQFNVSYQRYARVAVGRHATALRDAHNTYEREQRAWRRCEEELGAAKQKWEDANTAVGEAMLQKEEAEGEVSALRDSPEMKTAKDLERLATESERSSKSAEQAEGDLVQARSSVTEREKQFNQSNDSLGRDQRRLNERIDALRKVETPLGMRTPLEDAESSAAKVDSSRHRAAAEVQRLREQQRHLLKLSSAASQALLVLHGAEERRNTQEFRLNQARDAEADRQSEHKSASEQLVLSTSRWLESARLLRIVQPDAVIEELRRWCEIMSGANPVRLAVNEERARIENEIGKREGEINVIREGLIANRQKLLDEQKGLRDGIERSPNPPPTTDSALRDNRYGAPLWRVCDFHENLSSAERAGCEAALQAAGLLDAWITPRGELIGRDADIFIDCLNRPRVTGPNLAQLLKVTTNLQDKRAAALDVSIIETVLNSIGIEATGDVWITIGGEWHNGMLTGRWSKPEAEFIGAGAREAAKQRRLGEIDIELGRLDTEENTLRAEEGRLKASREKTSEEYGTLPEESETREALTKWSMATSVVEKERSEHERLSEAALERKREYDAAFDNLASNARELKLDLWIEKLGELRDVIDEIERHLNEVWHSFEALHRSQQSLERLRLELDRAKLQVAQHKERFEIAVNLAARLRKEYETLEEVAGPKARVAVERLKMAATKLEKRVDLLKQCNETSTKAEVAHVKLQERLDGLVEKLKIAEDERTKHIDAFRTFASTGMLEQLGESPDGVESWSATRLIDYVREVHARIGAEALSDEAWDRTQNNLHSDFEKLKTELSAHNLRPESESRHGVDVISVEYDGKLRRVPEVLVRINDEVTHRRELLNAEEREFIENHLIGEIADHLHKLISRAAELVSAMTAEVMKRPTFAAGMTLRFKWEPREDGPPDTKAVCDLLKRTKATWTEVERNKLAAFLQDRIQEIRNSPDFGTWRECLELAVDYRDWHTFSVEQKFDGDWRKLTKRTHGTGSSGEKAVALTIPQFAAAAAHYHSAPQAPRLILLDEVFVGIDPFMRANCMGLLESFDLDFVMTSENEWGCYPTISGLSICQLATRAGINAVAVTPWIWNGKTRYRANRLLNDTTGKDKAGVIAPEQNGAESQP